MGMNAVGAAADTSGLLPVIAPSYAVSDLTKIFPGTKALDGVSMEVYPGEIHVIIGKNGAGKTVLMSVIAGIYKGTSGSLEVGGKAVDVTRYSPAQARQIGVGVVAQDPMVAPNLSVIDNLLMGRMPQWHGLIRFGEGEQLVAEVSDRTGTTFQMKQRVGDLSIEDQQMLALGRSLFVDRVRVLLLDEITASLSRARKQRLKEMLRRAIAERPEISVTLITHHLEEIAEFCDRVTVLRDGRAVCTLDATTVSKEELAGWIVGSEREESGREPGSAATRAEALRSVPVLVTTERQTVEKRQTVLRVTSLSIGSLLEDFSLDLGLGEIVGIGGLDGSGKDEVFSIISGLQRPDRGSIEVEGKAVSLRTPSDARRRGIVYLPKKRDQDALLTGRSVEENLLMMVYRDIVSATGMINRTQARGLAQQSIDQFKIKTPSLRTPIDALSGGTRQKVVLARLVHAHPIVYLLNEPTRGIDLATKPQLLSAIRLQLAEGAGVIVTSESEEELTEICDRVIILYHGKVVAELTRGERDFTAGELYRLIQGVVV